MGSDPPLVVQILHVPKCPLLPSARRAVDRAAAVGRRRRRVRPQPAAQARHAGRPKAPVTARRARDYRGHPGRIQPPASTEAAYGGDQCHHCLRTGSVIRRRTSAGAEHRELANPLAQPAAAAIPV